MPQTECLMAAAVFFSVIITLLLCWVLTGPDPEIPQILKSESKTPPSKNASEIWNPDYYHTRTRCEGPVGKHPQLCQWAAWPEQLERNPECVVFISFSAVSSRALAIISTVSTYLGFSESSTVVAANCSPPHTHHSGAPNIFLLAQIWGSWVGEKIAARH